MLLLSLTVVPPVVPVTVAVFGTIEGVQSAVAVVFREQAYVQVSPGWSVDGVSSGPTASALSTSTVLDAWSALEQGGADAFIYLAFTRQRA